MARQSAGPFSEPDYKHINDLLKRCSNYRHDLSLAAEAKQPVSDYLKLCDELCTELEALKRVYFPDRP